MITTKDLNEQTRHTDAKKGGDLSKVDKDGANEADDDESHEPPTGRATVLCGTGSSTVDGICARASHSAGESPVTDNTGTRTAAKVTKKQGSHAESKASRIRGQLSVERQ